MSKAEILAELARLSPEDRAEVQARLDELAGDAWQDRGELSDADKSTLDTALAQYEKSPDAGSSWDQVKARIESKLRS
jgi:putative addiction module component (TIGR02574 family)